MTEQTHISATQVRRFARLLNGSIAEQQGRAWGTPLIPERVVDLTDASQFPEMALAREHARKLRIVEMPKSTPSSMEDRHVG